MTMEIMLVAFLQLHNLNNEEYCQEPYQPQITVEQFRSPNLKYVYNVYTDGTYYIREAIYMPDSEHPTVTYTFLTWDGKLMRHHPNMGNLQRTEYIYETWKRPERCDLPVLFDNLDQ